MTKKSKKKNKKFFKIFAILCILLSISLILGTFIVCENMNKNHNDDINKAYNLIKVCDLESEDIKEILEIIEIAKDDRHYRLGINIGKLTVIVTLQKYNEELTVFFYKIYEIKGE